MAPACEPGASGPSKGRQASDQRCALRGPVHSAAGGGEEIPVRHAVVPIERGKCLAPLHGGPQQEALGLLAIREPGVAAGNAKSPPGVDSLIVVGGRDLALRHRCAVRALRAVPLGRWLELFQRHDANARQRGQRSCVDLGQRYEGRVPRVSCCSRSQRTMRVSHSKSILSWSCKPVLAASGR